VIEFELVFAPDARIAFAMNLLTAWRMEFVEQGWIPCDRCGMGMFIDYGVDHGVMMKIFTCRFCGLVGVARVA
jgi:hypothetical protein